VSAPGSHQGERILLENKEEMPKFDAMTVVTLQDNLKKLLGTEMLPKAANVRHLLFVWTNICKGW
jgi:hypothetical protein